MLLKIVGNSYFEKKEEKDLMNLITQGKSGCNLIRIVVLKPWKLSISRMKEKRQITGQIDSHVCS